MSTSITVEFQALGRLVDSMEHILERLRAKMGLGTNQLPGIITRTPAEERAFRALASAISTYAVAVTRCRNASGSIAGNILLHETLEDPLSQNLLDWLDEVPMQPRTEMIFVQGAAEQSVIDHTPREEARPNPDNRMEMDEIDGFLGKLKLNCFAGLNIDTTDPLVSCQPPARPVVVEDVLPDLR